MTRDSDSTLTRPGVLQHGGAAGAAGLPRSAATGAQPVGPVMAALSSLATDTPPPPRQVRPAVP